VLLLRWDGTGATHETAEHTQNDAGPAVQTYGRAHGNPLVRSRSQRTNVAKRASARITPRDVFCLAHRQVRSPRNVPSDISENGCVAADVIADAGKSRLGRRSGNSGIAKVAVK
jgi:hypothetical protein